MGNLFRGTATPSVFLDEVYKERPTHSGKLTFESAQSLYDRGIIGLVEFRNWLANTYSDFDIVRDEDVDQEITKLAEQRKRLLDSESSLE